MKPLTDSTERIETYQNVINLLQKNNNLNYLGEFKKCLLELENNQEELEKLDETFKQDFSRVFKEQENGKKVLISNLKKVAGLLKLWAQATKNKAVDDKIDFLSEEWDDVSDKRLLKFTKRTLLIANKVGGYTNTAINNVSPKKVNKKLNKAAELVQDYGLSPEMINKLEDNSVNLIKSIISTDAINKEREKASKQIKKIFDRNDKILENKVEKLIQIYERPGSSFLNNYYMLRPQTNEVEKAPKVMV